MIKELNKQRLEHLKKQTSDGLLRELLAVIHRDGGHHTEKVGLANSVFDAEQKIEFTPYEAPKPFTGDFLAFLLVNALRHLNEEQRHNLALSLAVSDPLFSIDEYKKQKEN